MFLPETGNCCRIISFKAGVRYDYLCQVIKGKKKNIPILKSDKPVEVSLYITIWRNLFCNCIVLNRIDQKITWKFLANHLVPSNWPFLASFFFAIVLLTF